MASSPTIQNCLSITHTSFPCTTELRLDEEMVSDSEMNKAKFRFSRGHALLKKPFHKSLVLHPQKAFKRRFTFPGNQEQKILFKKRRRFASVALPTKFLLGGNINDPLNLRSLEDENVNQQLNSFTPASSPMPISRRGTQVQVLIPPNIYDPLNLNTGEEIEFNLLAKHRKRRRHRKNRREDSENAVETMHILTTKPETSFECSDTVENPIFVSQNEECAENETVSDTLANAPEDRTADKIVSPVVPQGSPAKFFKRYHSRSFSKDTEEKVCLYKQVTKRRRSKTRLQHHVDYRKFRANAEKFCYGNRIINWCSDEDTDQRLDILSKDIFCGKDIMDIGCNSGELTLCIAKHWNPRNIIGVDIDKKLINIAQRKIRRIKSESVSENVDFPQGLAAMYGSLAKFGTLNRRYSDYPNNVSFFEANYVPGCEEYLETQKPEYDVILCLRVTKWIHLNFGDEGLKMAFKRMYAQLRNGGHLILEPQPWFTYSTSKRITPSIYKTYCSLEMRPEMFREYLLSEVGFSSCRTLGRIYNYSKVYRQPLYLLTKGFQTSCCRNNQRAVLPSIPFHSDQWNRNSDEQGACSWSDAGYMSSYNRLSHPDMQH